MALILATGGASNAANIGRVSPTTSAAFSKLILAAKAVETIKAQMDEYTTANPGAIKVRARLLASS